MSSHSKVSDYTALAEHLYQPQKLWLSLHEQLSKAGKTEEAEQAYQKAMMIAAAWRAGAEYGARRQ